ncbi:MAG: hypothetical protein HUK25_02870, partial [Treponema sp.]|nr:hypothetical protein [Treponema sp.]
WNAELKKNANYFVKVKNRDDAEKVFYEILSHYNVKASLVEKTQIYGKDYNLEKLMSGDEYEWHCFQYKESDLQNNRYFEFEEYKKAIINFEMAKRKYARHDNKIKEALRKQSSDEGHRKIKEVFSNYLLRADLYEKGFDLNKLDELNTPEEFAAYLQPFFINEKGEPLDNNASISFSKYKDGRYCGFIPVKTKNSVVVEFSDVYGTKKELSRKKYVVGETMFYYPYYNGKWTKDGYRAGKLVWESVDTVGVTPRYDYETKDCLVIRPIGSPNKYYWERVLDLVEKTEKNNIIIDLYGFHSGSSSFISDYLKKTIFDKSFKNMYVLVDRKCWDFGNDFAHDMKEKGATLIGEPTRGDYLSKWTSRYTIEFDTFTCNLTLQMTTYAQFQYRDDVVEGYGITPDIYCNDINDAFEILRILTGDEELSYTPDKQIIPPSNLPDK